MEPLQLLMRFTITHPHIYKIATTLTNDIGILYRIYNNLDLFSYYYNSAGFKYSNEADVIHRHKFDTIVRVENLQLFLVFHNHSNYETFTANLPEGAKITRVIYANLPQNIAFIYKGCKIAQVRRTACDYFGTYVVSCVSHDGNKHHITLGRRAKNYKEIMQQIDMFKKYRLSKPRSSLSLRDIDNISTPQLNNTCCNSYYFI